ncbi:transglutaminase-like domain-containing protein [Endozoicomonas sp. SESOKO2]|uniref:transglutaminase-like domain-containing protein n=1 Tax=Endozoicomonas sp. SESOKO2 TaxID=2828743 RepID=UPI0021471EA1|nr:transglutaminase-like domain-containing protein [Endozoicomonas sp. SESOKO2]
MSRGELDSGLCKWLNQTVSGIDRPWLIRRSDLNSMDEKRHEIRIKTDLGEEEARTEILKGMARAKWLTSGLSPEPERSDNILTGALYRYWQQRWIVRHFGSVGVDANSVFPLTEEQQQTLKMPTSEPYLQEIDQRISAWDANAVQWWPAFWQQTSNLPNPRVDDCINKAPAMGGDNTPETYNPEVLGKWAPALDQRTNYESLPVPTSMDYIVFNSSRHSSRMYRWWARDIFVSAKGDVKEIVLNNRHIQEVEALLPVRLPGRDQAVALASDQTLGTVEMLSKNGRYALPSLTPDDYIVALRIEPDLPFTLVRDQYTGLHTLTVPETKADQSLRVTYVVEPRATGNKTPAKRTRPTLLDTYCSEGMKKVLHELFQNIGEQPSELKVSLQKIQNAKNAKQQIKAITEYCEQFSGKAKPRRKKNFFKFLVTKRQGSCRHRVPVFIAFCRYFGIPCRQIDNRVHCFAEYSLDGGQTWKSADLGGADAEIIEITSHFQPIRRVNVFSTESRKIKALLKDFLKRADSAQQQILAKACGMSLAELNKALETNSALPETNLRISEIVRNLWEEKDLTRFSMGVALLESLETQAFGYNEKQLVGDDGYNPMSEAVKHILSNSDKDQVTEQLKLLHSKMFVQWGANPLLWLGSMEKILNGSDLARPSFLRFALEALKSGWLDPVPNYYEHITGAFQHHQLLLHLERIDELKFEAAHCLKKCYWEFLSREKNSQAWRLAYKNFRQREGDVLFVTHCHDGFSRSLESKIASSSLQAAWTDEPEGVPNIERMLLHHPAFQRLISGKASHRPVIIMGQPSWCDTMINEKVEALFQLKVESRPNLKQILEKINQRESARKQICDALKKSETQNYRANFIKSVPPEERLPLHNEIDECNRAILQAFSHYLYGMTHSNGGCLTYCWADASNEEFMLTNTYGAHDPSSPEELYAMMSTIDDSPGFQEAVKDDYLREALNASDALVLRSHELTTIAEEFLSSVNLKSIFDSLDT